MASDMLTTPLKSIMAKWSMGMPVSWWTASTVQAGPYLRVLLIWP